MISVHKPAWRPMLAMFAGAAIALGCWMPWMSYFAGLEPLRGVIGVNGRVLFGAGMVALIAGAIRAWSSRARARRLARGACGALGLGVIAAAAWLLVGVRELTRVRASNAMLAPRAGAGLFVVLIGGCVLAAAAVIADERERQRSASAADESS